MRILFFKSAHDFRVSEAEELIARKYSDAEVKTISSNRRYEADYYWKGGFFDFFEQEEKLFSVIRDKKFDAGIIVCNNKDIKEYINFIVFCNETGIRKIIYLWRSKIWEEEYCGFTRMLFKVYLRIYKKINTSDSRMLKLISIIGKFP